MTAVAPVRRVSTVGTSRVLHLLITFLALAIVPGATSSLAGNSLFSESDIRKISPRANQALAKALVEATADFENAGIVDRLRAAHFIAQIMTETNGLSRLDENMKYRAETLLRVFSRTTISEAKAREIAGKERQIANWVYGNRLGNRGRKTEDGWDYRGSGYIQLTGRENFRKRGREIKVDLEANPELARKAKDGLLAALAYWQAVDANRAADNNDLRRVRVLVNGARAHGYDQSRFWFRQAWKIVSKNAGSSGNESGEELAEALSADEQEIFDQILKNSGLASEGFEAEADANTERSNAIKQMQKELGIEATGVLDEETRYALLDPIEWRKFDDKKAALNHTGNLVGTDVFDVAAAPANTESAVEPISPVAGSGVTVENNNISPSTLALLDSSNAMYSQYERSSSASDDPETFLPFSVFEPDERSQISNTGKMPASAIVNIIFRDEMGGNHTCSGAMISANTVLTAAHCLHSGTLGGAAFTDFMVIPGRNAGEKPFGQCKGVKAFIPRGWTNSESDGETRYHDFAALKLDCTIGQATGSLGLRTLADTEIGIGTDVQGYSGNKAPPGVQWLSSNKLLVLWELKGFYQNDTYGGTSGAPVFESGKPDVIIGIHTNGRFGNEEPWKSNNAFTRITEERLAQIQQWLKE